MVSKTGFTGSLLVIFLVSVALRFWGLGRFDEWVFDEVYYAEFAQNYLTQTPFFDAHPPLGKYLIALGLWLTQLAPWIDSSQLTEESLPRIAYRWMTALTGAMIPLLVSALAYQLSQRRWFTLLAGSLTALDGLLLVESRYGLINIYLLAFGLLGQTWFIWATHRTGRQHNLGLLLAGISFGAAVSVKWYGLGFWLPIGLIWLGAKVMSPRIQALVVGQQWQSWIKIRTWKMLVMLGMLPALVYRLVWIPHLRFNTDYGFWGMQWQILNYHRNVGGSLAEHPYCSPWHSWPMMVRPIAYFYQPIQDVSGEVSTVYDVHGMGNPALWWLSTWAMLGVLGLVIWQGIQRRDAKPLTIFIIISYAANFLPWILVTRCSFLYYYMSASLFSFLALAWWIEQSFCSDYRWCLLGGITALCLVTLSLIYWLPLYLGLPLPLEGFHSRMWLRSWY